MDVPKGTAEAGCWLEPSAVGRGLVTKAVRAIIDWAVEERGIHRVEWVVSSENAASIAVARRLGMTKDGVLRESYPYRGLAARHGGLVGAGAGVAGRLERLIGPGGDALSGIGAEVDRFRSSPSAPLLDTSAGRLLWFPSGGTAAGHRGRNPEMNTRTRTASSAAKGLLAGAMLLTGLLAGTPAAHADHQSCSNRTDVPGVCLKVVNEGLRVTYAEAYHDGRTGAWTGHIDLHREG
ncbi:GNAT family N-acetyltransferase [Nonomuraea ferruginea]